MKLLTTILIGRYVFHFICLIFWDTLDFWDVLLYYAFWWDLLLEQNVNGNSYNNLVSHRTVPKVECISFQTLPQYVDEQKFQIGCWP